MQVIHSDACTVLFFFFFNDTATTEIYTLSLHDALPISSTGASQRVAIAACSRCVARNRCRSHTSNMRSEEHTSELQSHSDLVCRLLLEKKNLRRGRLCCASDTRWQFTYATQCTPPLA